jgi:hypothetical protein
VNAGETLRLMRSLKIPESLRLKRPAMIVIVERDKHHTITGCVQLEIRHSHHKDEPAR